jgi:hypothetical protein
LAYFDFAKSTGQDLIIMSSYALRRPESLKLASKRLAAADDTTMNQFFVVAIAEKVSAMETAAFFERRGATASKEKADRAWAKVGKNEPSAEDR